LQAKAHWGLFAILFQYLTIKSYIIAKIPSSQIRADAAFSCGSAAKPPSDATARPPQTCRIFPAAPADSRKTFALA
jgi:hypothetical protein